MLFSGEFREHLLCFCIVLPVPWCHVTGKLFLQSDFCSRLEFPHGRRKVGTFGKFKLLGVLYRLWNREAELLAFF